MKPLWALHEIGVVWVITLVIVMIFVLVVAFLIVFVVNIVDAETV